MSPWLAFVKARHVPLVLGVATGLVVVATVAGGAVASLPQLRGPELRAGTIALVGVALGALGGQIAHSSADDVERRTVRRRGLMEAGLFVAVGGLLMGAALGLGVSLSPSVPLVAVRNAGGMFGLVYLLIAWWGLDRGVVVSAMYVGASTFMAADSLRHVALWSWFLAPAGEGRSMWVGAVLFVAGTVTALLRPITDGLSGETPR